MIAVKYTAGEVAAGPFKFSLLFSSQECNEEVRIHFNGLILPWHTASRRVVVCTAIGEVAAGPKRKDGRLSFSYSLNFASVDFLIELNGMKLRQEALDFILFSPQKSVLPRR